MIDHKIILYHANWSFCSQMVRVALSEKGLVFKKKHIKLCDQYSEGENIDKDFLTINPLATVPAIKIDKTIICGSEEIIYQLNKLDGANDINLYPKHIDINEIRLKASDTTISEGVKFASTLGTIIPIFSSPLIQHMIKKLPFRSILKILKNHPRKDRKMIFLAMYFGNPTKKFPNMGIKNYVKEILKLEKTFSDGREYFFNSFSHVDINLMCVFNRLIDVGLEPTILSNRTPHLSRYWDNLKSRDSYKIGILNYYTEKEEKVLHQFHKNNDSSVLDKILKEIDLVEVNE